MPLLHLFEIRLIISRLAKQTFIRHMSKLRVLLVEDNEFLRFTTKKQIETVGLECQTALNGREAVERAVEPYLFILMDLSMPVLGGIEATLEIRENEMKTGRKRTPIIGLTAFNEMDKCLNAGMDDFIRKPLFLERLRQLVVEFSTKTELTAI